MFALDANGNVFEATVEEWAACLEDVERRVVGHDKVDEGCVSTVFVGLNYRFFGDGPPLLWETLVRGGPLDGQGQRYDSFEAAAGGHGTWVAKVLTYRGTSS